MRNALAYYEAGYTALVSVIPPHAEISEYSKINDKDRGKSPGVMGASRKWQGYSGWETFIPTRTALENWLKVDANIGFNAAYYPAIDIDITDEAIASAIVTALELELGPCLVRTGRYPKQLLVFRSDVPLRTFQIHYEEPLTGDRILIEFLGKGRQYVMDGTHPVTEKPYTIVDPNFALELGPVALQDMSQDKAAHLFNHIIKPVVASFGFEATKEAPSSEEVANVQQDKLKAPDIETLGELLERTPNIINEREGYVEFGYAVKAASQDDPERGFELFMDWCSRWENGYNDPSVVENEWAKMTPPFRLGYGWLLDKTRQMGVNVWDLEFGQASPKPDVSQGDFEVEDAEVEASKTAVAESADDVSGRYSERWLANEFIRLYRHEFLLPFELKETAYYWTDHGWELDANESNFRHKIGRFLNRKTAQALTDFVDKPDKIESIGLRLGSKRTLDSVTALIRNDPRMSCAVDDLDSQPHLLNTPYGPVDLKTGQLLAPKPEWRLVTRTDVPVEQRGTPWSHGCPVWEQFINQVTQGDTNKAFYLQCLAGYALTGETKEQIFPFFVGAGMNGKSVFLDTLQDVMGDYAEFVNSSVFEERGNTGSLDYIMANIKGKRLVVTSEISQNAKWNDARLKQFTGQDKIQARQIYGRPFSFNSTAVLIAAGNHTPDLNGASDAIARRLKIVPWNYRPVTPDKDLGDKLGKELPGILSWCVEGAMHWYQFGLPESVAIKGSTDDYIENHDPIGVWMKCQVEITGNRESSWVATHELYHNHTIWARLNEEVPYPSAAAFGRALKEKMNSINAEARRFERPEPVRRHRTSEGMGWKGIMLKEVEAAGPSNVVPFKGSVDPRTRQG